MQTYELTAGTMPAINEKLSECCDNGYMISISKSKDVRRLRQNSLQHVFVKKIADFLGEEDIENVTVRAKLKFGLPLLLAQECKDSMKIIESLQIVGFEYMTHEMKLKVIDLLPVTSVLSVKNHALMLDNMQMYWGKHGLRLE